MRDLVSTCSGASSIAILFLRVEVRVGDEICSHAWYAGKDLSKAFKCEVQVGFGMMRDVICMTITCAGAAGTNLTTR